MVLLNTYGTHKAHFLVDPCVCVRALKVRQSRNDFFLSAILPKNEQMNSTLLLYYMIPQVDLFSFFFGRIDDTKKAFRNQLTFMGQMGYK